MNARRIYYVDRKIFCDVEAIPFVVYSDNQPIDGIARLVAVTIKQCAVESPFEVHWILGEDEAFIVVSERNPLTIDVHLSTWDLVDYTMIVSLLKGSGFIRFKVCR